jgi:hypothetical protein
MKAKTRPSGANLDRAALAHAEEMTRPTYCGTIFFLCKARLRVNMFFAIGQVPMKPHGARLQRWS